MIRRRRSIRSFSDELTIFRAERRTPIAKRQLILYRRGIAKLYGQRRASKGVNMIMNEVKRGCAVVAPVAITRGMKRAVCRCQGLGSQASSMASSPYAGEMLGCVEKALGLIQAEPPSLREFHVHGRSI